MTSRERIRAAIHREPTDRVPIDLGGTRQSGIAAVAYARLKRHLGIGLDRPGRVFDLFQMRAEIDPGVGDRLGNDCVGLHRRSVAFGISNEGWKRFTFPDGFECEVPGGFNPRCGAGGEVPLGREGVVVGELPAGGFYIDSLE